MFVPVKIRMAIQRGARLINPLYGLIFVSACECFCQNHSEKFRRKINIPKTMHLFNWRTTLISQGKIGSLKKNKFFCWTKSSCSKKFGFPKIFLSLEEPKRLFRSLVSQRTNNGSSWCYVLIREQHIMTSFTMHGLFKKTIQFGSCSESRVAVEQCR